jgi:hypothetical protein
MKTIKNLLSNLESQNEKGPEEIINLNNLVVGNIKGGMMPTTNYTCVGGYNGSCLNNMCGEGTNVSCTNLSCS